MSSYALLIVLAVAIPLFGILSFAISLFTPPRDFPKNVPTVPFYYALMPLFKDVDQAQLYHEYLKKPLEQYGAVKIFFGGRWNILVRKPSYIAEIFKHEDIYAKAGNHIKIPHSLIAEYTGENIISAHGEVWKLYTSVIKPALQRDQDSTLFWQNSRLLRSMFLEDEKTTLTGVPVYGFFQRYALANLSEVLYGSSFETLQRPDSSLNELQTMIKPRIFHPIFLNFPFLDNLNLKSRQIGRQLVRVFRNALRNEIATSHNHVCDPDSSNLACRLLGAYHNGTLSEKQLNDNIVITFTAGHENPQLAFISLMYCLGQHLEEQEKLRNEIDTLFSANSNPNFEPDYASVHDLPILTATLYECLRLYPPISQVINRRTTEPVTLGKNDYNRQIHIPAGAYVGYNCYSTNRDVDFWGADADEFKPSRWGTNMEDIQNLYRRANAKGTFITFHGGRRACLGQKFSMQQLRITTVELLRGLRWRIDESWDGRMTPAGPLYPRGLKLRFEELKVEVMENE
ncbi:putative cytochrome P450 [Lophiostoma macrostomum CBS 122681]|uniref:Putative cytochrome P450 n=1 Tax=Lophiostoma macrostomum CBS 122681 TaxID=1314788 RepID=A0A6A6ST06_9PLEO|nr:putative cytochrome P450 [Lophiostoma macrostomum CBS 122681]